MRLIDADKLQSEIDYWNAHDDPKQKDYDTRDIDQIVGFAEEIEAIPVEWIDTYCTDCSIDLRDNDAKAIKKLLDDWRQENEKA